MSITLEINNSYSQVIGLTSEQHNKLRKILSYNTDPQAKFFAGGNYPTIRYLIDTKGNFPTGLLDRVEGFLINLPTVYKTKDLRIKPKSTLGMFKPKIEAKPYPAQLKAIEMALHHSRGTISMPTGTGKSFVIALIIARLNVKTLIVVPNLELKRQLTEDLQRTFGKTPNITVENVDSVKPGNYDCLIIDESHHVAAKTYQKLNKTAWSNIFYRFFMTATPFRNNKEENILFECIAGEIIYSLSYKEAIAAGYIVPVEAYYIEMPKTPNDFYTWAEVYSHLVVNNELRNKAIAGLLETLHASGISTLCLVKEIKHGENLVALTGGAFVNGQDETTRAYIDLFNKRKLKVLMGTTGIIGEGVDTKPCEYVIIAGLGKAKSAFMQQVGRAVRKYEGKETAKVILVKDKSHRFTIKHYNEQVKILWEEYGIKPTKI